jgi:hypothetical protein
MFIHLSKAISNQLIKSQVNHPLIKSHIKSTYQKPNQPSTYQKPYQIHLSLESQINRPITKTLDYQGDRSVAKRLQRTEEVQRVGGRQASVADSHHAKKLQHPVQ